MGDRSFWRNEEMSRGQAERLIPMLHELLDEAGAHWADLSALAVGIGPGNFTGIRISVATARGLALALGIHAVGVSLFEVRAFGSAQTHPGSELLVCLDAPRDTVYLQLFRDEVPIAPAQHFKPGIDTLTEREKAALGWGQNFHRALLGGEVQFAAIPPSTVRSLPRTQAIAARKLASGEPIERPAPLYVRPADAAPPKQDAPVILP